MELFLRLFDNALYVTVLVILISSLIGFYVKMRGRDRCLRDFDGFRITAETQDDHVAWGTLRTYSTGVELLYIAADPDSDAYDGEEYTKHSYILYSNELNRLFCLYRFHDHQPEKQRKKRERDIRRTYKPGIFRQVARWVRNLFSTFKDAIVQTTNAVLSARAAQTQSVLLSRHKELTASGAQLVSSAVGNAYDPILEAYIGRYVIVEIQSDGETIEEHGILKEYSAQYLELLNVKVQVPLGIYVQRRPSAACAEVHIDREGRVARVHHDLDRPLFVESLRWGDHRRDVLQEVPAGEAVEIELSEEEAQHPLAWTLEVRCLADMIVPRAVALVRHGGKRDKLSWDEWLGVDDLPYLPWLRRLFRAEERRSEARS
jgi:hypothetical protein